MKRSTAVLPQFPQASKLDRERTPEWVGAVDRLVFPLSIASASATATLLVMRVLSVLRDSHIAQTTGGEAPGLYGIYRVWGGEPVYQSLSQNPSTMIYNFLFFWIYGGVSRLVTDRAELLPAVTHVLTLAVSLSLVLAIFYYFKRESSRQRQTWDRRQTFVLISLLVVGVLGPFTSWWCLTARPDLLAVGMELLAFLIFVSDDESHSVRSILLMTAAAFVAWSCKQSSLFIYAGILCCLARERRWKMMGLSAGAFSLSCLAVFAIAGRAYLEHTVVASGSLPWFMSQVIAVSRHALPGAYVWLPAMALAIAFLRKRAGRSRIDIVFLIVLATTTLGGLATSGREGASRNYLLSSFIVGLLWVARHGWMLAPGARRSPLASWSLSATFAIALVFTLPVIVFPETVGRARLLTDAERAEAVERRAVIQSAAHPVFVQWAYFALPWNSNQHVTDVIDWDIYRRARSRNVIVSVEDRIEAGFYASAVVDDARLIAVLDRAGYRRVSLPTTKTAAAYFVRPSR
jgi:hypothetical protein